MQIERAVIGITTLGPGNRMGIWVNGCHRRCKGCVSERLQAPAPFNEMEVYSFFDMYDLTGLDGVTISGGEPFDQLSELQKTVRYFSDKGIRDILIYTGFTYEELAVRNDPRIEDIFSRIGVLIDGPYMEALDTDKGNLKGSDNQRIIFFRQELKELYGNYYRDKREMQEFIYGSFRVAVGIPSKEAIRRFKSGK